MQRHFPTKVSTSLRQQSKAPKLCTKEIKYQYQPIIKHSFEKSTKGTITLELALNTFLCVETA